MKTKADRKAGVLGRAYHCRWLTLMLMMDRIATSDLWISKLLWTAKRADSFES